MCFLTYKKRMIFNITIKRSILLKKKYILSHVLKKIHDNFIVDVKRVWWKLMSPRKCPCNVCNVPSQLACENLA